MSDRRRILLAVVMLGLCLFAGYVALFGEILQRPAAGDFPAGSAKKVQQRPIAPSAAPTPDPYVANKQTLTTGAAPLLDSGHSFSLKGAGCNEGGSYMHPASLICLELKDASSNTAAKATSVHSGQPTSARTIQLALAPGSANASGGCNGTWSWCMTYNAATPLITFKAKCSPRTLSGTSANNPTYWAFVAGGTVTLLGGSASYWYDYVLTSANMTALGCQ